MKRRKYSFEETTAPYRQWRYRWDVGAVHDVDQIEWRGDKPLCVIELTECKHNLAATERAVRERLWQQFSGRKIRKVAQALGVPMVVVLYDQTMEELSVCVLDAPDAPWQRCSQESYQSWLSRWQPGSPPPPFDAAQTTNTP